ncbi:MAG: hypothetical protein M3O64_02255 [Chloroflexota bacterium]|nr:hypothetical protein [Chloroflexota bacterium]
MRQQPGPIQPPATLRVELEERLRVTAARLQAMPAELATSLSVTTGWQERTEADVSALAAAIAAPFGHIAAVERCADSVTVTFRRPGRRPG